jgi:hypothetical protein
MSAYLSRLILDETGLEVFLSGKKIIGSQYFKVIVWNIFMAYIFINKSRVTENMCTTSSPGRHVPWTVSPHMYCPLPDVKYWARIFKRLWSPGIDSKEWTPPAYVAWRAGTKTLFLLGSYGG